jgi:hypothetical protein
VTKGQAQIDQSGSLGLIDRLGERHVDRQRALAGPAARREHRIDSTATDGDRAARLFGQQLLVGVQRALRDDLEHLAHDLGVAG